jgi:hypothetical protein
MKLCSYYFAAFVVWHVMSATGRAADDRTLCGGLEGKVDTAIEACNRLIASGQAEGRELLRYTIATEWVW